MAAECRGMDEHELRRPTEAAAGRAIETIFPEDPP